jgi:hypothetical protein
MSPGFSARPAAANARKAVPAHPATDQVDADRPSNTEPPVMPEGPNFARTPVHGTPRTPAEVRDRVGAGSPLPAEVRAAQETRFGTSFADVRVHSGAPAADLAQQQLARAFTVGTEIVFNRGRYQPSSLSGRRLLGHELAHVLQQRGGSGLGGGRHESAADRAAVGAVAGVGPSAAVGIQREPLSDAEIAELAPDEVRARLLANQGERDQLMRAPEVLDALAHERKVLKRRAAELGIPVSDVRSIDPRMTSATIKATPSVRAELDRVTAFVDRLGKDVPARPEHYALNDLRATLTLLRADQQAIVRDGAAMPEAVSWINRLVTEFEGVVAGAENWHTAHHVRSLGMINDEAQDKFATATVRNILKDNDLRAGANLVGLLAVSTADVLARLFSFGVYDTDTAVATSFNRGDVSWDEGSEAVYAGYARGGATAAVSGFTGGLLGPGGTVAKGAAKGAATAVVTQSAESMLTSVVDTFLSSPRARALFESGAPDTVQSWALAIAIGAVQGAGQASRLRAGGTVKTARGTLRIDAVTEDGQVTLTPTDAPGGLPAPPASSEPLFCRPETGWTKIPAANDNATLPTEPQSVQQAATGTDDTAISVEPQRQPPALRVIEGGGEGGGEGSGEGSGDGSGDGAPDRPRASSTEDPSSPAPVAQPKRRSAPTPGLAAARQRAKELRGAVKKDSAAMPELEEFHAEQPDTVLKKMPNDPVAAKELRKRQSRAAFNKAIENSKRPPHEATLKITDARGSTISASQKIVSGGVTHEQSEEFGAWESSLRSHTEAKAVRENPLSPGQTMWIAGQYDPCGSCRAAMQQAADASGGRINYWWPGGPKGGVWFVPAK